MTTKEAAALLGVSSRDILGFVDAGFLGIDDSEDLVEPDINDDDVYRLGKSLAWARRGMKTP